MHHVAFLAAVFMPYLRWEKIISTRCISLLSLLLPPLSSCSNGPVSVWFGGGGNTVSESHTYTLALLQERHQGGCGERGKNLSMKNLPKWSKKTQYFYCLYHVYSTRICFHCYRSITEKTDSPWLVFYTKVLIFHCHWGCKPTQTWSLFIIVKQRYSLVQLDKRTQIVKKIQGTC